MGRPFFFRAIPIYGVLPYSMIWYKLQKHFVKNEEACRDRIPKKQQNQVRRNDTTILLRIVFLTFLSFFQAHIHHNFLHATPISNKFLQYHLLHDCGGLVLRHSKYCGSWAYTRTWKPYSTDCCRIYFFFCLSHQIYHNQQ